MIEWNRVLELRDEVGAEDFSEVVDLFLEEVGEAIDRLRTGQTQTNLEADLHFLKGSALNLGFQDFARLCEDGERRAGQSTVSVETIVDAYDASLAVFEREMPARCGLPA